VTSSPIENSTDLEWSPRLSELFHRSPWEGGGRDRDVIKSLERNPKKTKYLHF